jgi:hypothetical protein
VERVAFRGRAERLFGLFFGLAVGLLVGLEARVVCGVGFVRRVFALDAGF